MSYGFLAIGCMFLVAGVVYLAYLMNVSQAYAMGSALILVAIVAAMGMQNTRRSRI